MVTVDKALETKSAVNAYTVRFYSKRYGHMETRGYDKVMTAKGQATKVMQQEADYDGCEIYEWNVLIHTETFGYDARIAIQRLRAFRNCCRPVIGGWECEAEGFRLLVEKGYIVPADNHLDHDAGYWLITERFKKIGNYLVKRRWW
jgi:hypothetical protein